MNIILYVNYTSHTHKVIVLLFSQNLLSTFLLSEKAEVTTVDCQPYMGFTPICHHSGFSITPAASAHWSACSSSDLPDTTYLRALCAPSSYSIQCPHHTCLPPTLMQLWLAQWGFLSFTPLLIIATLSPATPAISLLYFPAHTYHHTLHCIYCRDIPCSWLHTPSTACKPEDKSWTV